MVWTLCCWPLSCASPLLNGPYESTGRRQSRPRYPVTRAAKRFSTVGNGSTATFIFADNYNCYMFSGFYIQGPTRGMNSKYSIYP
ncbi:hypothetical protein PF008_g28966 [Phytophthora fragariae]|uniref:Uncharacterized protein n=1 Tax=Phytophthora fragariae TaxID=53985 RepID=A0A6G0Q9W5_9STRA|nr:hypothetical protein PF008_g28966 [Phytophthora fragariae]